MIKKIWTEESYKIFFFIFFSFMWFFLVPTPFCNIHHPSFIFGSCIFYGSINTIESFNNINRTFCSSWSQLKSSSNASVTWTKLDISVWSQVRYLQHWTNKGAKELRGWRTLHFDQLKVVWLISKSASTIKVSH